MGLISPMPSVKSAEGKSAGDKRRTASQNRIELVNLGNNLGLQHASTITGCQKSRSKLSEIRDFLGLTL